MLSSMSSSWMLSLFALLIHAANASGSRGEDTFMRHAPPREDPLFAQQWYLQSINVGNVWKAGIEGKGITIALIDDSTD